MYTYGFTLLFALALVQPAAASMLLAEERFDAYAGTGLAPGGGNGMLDSNVWSVTGASDGAAPFGASRAQGDLARGVSAGGERTGGLYAFTLPGDVHGVGVQATSSDFTPGALVFRFANDTGTDLSRLEASFDFWVLNDGARSTRMSVAAAADAGPWLPVPALTLDSPGSPDAEGWQLTSVSAALPVTGLLAGDALELRWEFDDLAGSGGRDEIALSGLRLAGSQAPDSAVLPAPSTALLFLAGLICIANPRRRSLTALNSTATLR